MRRHRIDYRKSFRSYSGIFYLFKLGSKWVGHKGKDPNFNQSLNFYLNSFIGFILGFFKKEVEVEHVHKTSVELKFGFKATFGNKSSRFINSLD